MADGARLRIGELSRRVGVSPELLRAWESRYGLLEPERTAGGLRLFSEDDQRRVLRMRKYISAGLSASEAARLAKAQTEPSPNGEAALAEIERDLEDALTSFDEPLAQAALDRLFAEAELQAALGEVVLPLLDRVGERWANGTLSVVDEHFASNLLGGRLRALSRDWGEGVGPSAILACPPGERHDLGLLCFGLALREAGWRIIYFGADTPIGDIDDVLAERAPAVVVLAAVTSQTFLDAAEQILALRERVRVALGGRGATAAIAERLGAELLGADAIAQAARLAS